AGFFNNSSSCQLKKEVTSGGYAGSLTDGTHSSSELMSVPSYGLNSITATAGGVVYWAVGDKGAILRLGGHGTVGSPSDPPAPQLGASEPAALPDRGAYEPFEPPAQSAEAGAVPAFAAQPLDRIAAP